MYVYARLFKDYIRHCEGDYNAVQKRDGEIVKRELGEEILWFSSRMGNKKKDTYRLFF